MPTTYILYSTILDKYYIGSTDMAVKDRLKNIYLTTMDLRQKLKTG